jgi:hypothetical protein
MKLFPFFAAPFIIGSLFLAGCGGGGDNGNGGSGKDSAVQMGVVDSAAGFKLANDYYTSIHSAVTAPNQNSGTIYADGNLFFKLTTSNNVLTITYFKDQAATVPAGTIVITRPVNPNQLPQVYAATVDVTGGSHPAHGNLTLTNPSSTGQGWQFDGQLATSSGTFTNWSFSLILANGSGTGSFSASNNSQTISLTNITASSNGTTTTFQGNLSIQPQNFNAGWTLVVNNADGSSSITLSDGTTAHFDSSGNGSITFADRVTVPVGHIFAGV